jgi:ArsR family transcriptional regulator
MELVRVYRCLCDLTRLRLLHLLQAGPLCVCHLQAILREPQAKVSKHLAYLRRAGLVVGERQGHWVIYRLPSAPPPALAAHLACLQDAAREHRLFRVDAARRARLITATAAAPPACS